MSVHGQVVLGPPGSGKTTHCRAMRSMLHTFGRRPIIVNLDPANDSKIGPLQNPATGKSVEDVPLFNVDIRELVALEDVMDATELGPNGGLVYCLDLIVQNVSWLVTAIKHECDAPSASGLCPYVIIDCPGQVEVYTHGKQLKEILLHLESELNLRLCGVHLVDASHCSDASKFLSCSMLSLSAMTRMELPWVNVLSKVDTFSAFGAPPLGLDAYTDSLDLTSVLDSAVAPSKGAEETPYMHSTADVAATGGDDQDGGDAAVSESIGSTSTEAGLEGVRWRASDASPMMGTGHGPRDGTVELYASRSGAFFRRWKGLHRALVEVMDSYALVGFLPSTVKDARATARLLRRCDKATGYAFGALHEATEASAASMVDRVDIDSDATARREAEQEAMDALMGIMAT